MPRGPINKKDLAIESYYGYMNIHLDLLKIAILNKQENEVLFQKSQLKKIRSALIKLGYFGITAKIDLELNEIKERDGLK